MWNIQKVKPILSKECGGELSKARRCANEVLATLREAQKLLDNGDDKLGYMLADMAYDDIPGDIKNEVKRMVEEELGPEKPDSGAEGETAPDAPPSVAPTNPRI